MRRAAGVIVALAVVLGGCRKKKEVLAPVAIKGKVERADGLALKGLMIAFHPDEESNKRGRLLLAPLDEDGAFAGDCLPGRYKVTLTPIPKHGGAPLGAGGAPGTGPASLPEVDFPASYLKADTTPWKDVVVPAGGTEALVLKLE
jgi:hypothetical protein